ncbi:MAG: type II toxin-antitoxin system RelE/ParE family toxin [Armatimonadetes bacterium]|nr:type II toxin-antitoxin system RelE/ParE family toxin [Armatimonadota bacterium]
MAYEVVVMPSAEADLLEYADFIAADSRQQAAKWLSRAWEIIFSLSDNPRKFALIEEAEELGAEIRDVLHYSHRIVYRVREDEQVVEILRVYHGARKPISNRDLH